MTLCDKVLIAGFSGSGKSSLLQNARLVAPREWELFDDLDEIILKRYGKGQTTLSFLIQEHGWEKFRLWERQSLDSWLKEEGKGVLALGGGTLSSILWEIYGQSRKIKFCHLDTPFEICWNRLQFDKAEPRPLLELGKLKFKEIYDDRSKLFSKISWKLDGSKSLELLAQDFWKEL